MESGSILRLSEVELLAPEDTGVAFRSASKGKPSILRRTTRGRFRPQESMSSKPTQSLPRAASSEVADVAQLAERTTVWPLSRYHEDSDGADELDLLGSPSTSLPSAQFARVVHTIDSEVMVSAHENVLVSPEAETGESNSQDYRNGSVEYDLGLEVGKGENSEIHGEGRVEDRLPNSPIIITVDAEVPMITSELASPISRSIVPHTDVVPVIEAKGGRVSEDGSIISQPAHAVDSPMLVAEREGPLISSDRHRAGPLDLQTAKSPNEACMADAPPSSDSHRRSPMLLRSQLDSALTVLPPARRPIISLAASSSVASEPHFNLEGTLPCPWSPHPPTSPVQPRHQFEREYTLPSLKLLPLEYNRKVKSAKLQRKRDKGRDKNEGRRDKDGTRDDWYPLGLNRWTATVNANPVWKRVSRASKCLSTREWAVSVYIHHRKLRFENSIGCHVGIALDTSA